MFNRKAKRIEALMESVDRKADEIRALHKAFAPFCDYEYKVEPYFDCWGGRHGFKWSVRNVTLDTVVASGGAVEKYRRAERFAQAHIDGLLDRRASGWVGHP